jgi:hypothetical protein
MLFGAISMLASLACLPCCRPCLPPLVLLVCYLVLLVCLPPLPASLGCIPCLPPLVAFLVCSPCLPPLPCLPLFAALACLPWLHSNPLPVAYPFCLFSLPPLPVYSLACLACLPASLACIPPLPASLACLSFRASVLLPLSPCISRLFSYHLRPKPSPLLLPWPVLPPSSLILLSTIASSLVVWLLSHYYAHRCSPSTGLRAHLMRWALAKSGA